jgi:hypothetical protein
VASPLSLQAKADFEISDGVKFELNPFVLAASFYGWVLPTVFIPSNIPLYGSKVLSVFSVPPLIAPDLSVAGNWPHPGSLQRDH